MNDLEPPTSPNSGKENPSLGFDSEQDLLLTTEEYSQLGLDVLVESYPDFLKQAVQSVGDEDASKRMQINFAFFADSVVKLIAATDDITEQLISRIIPYVTAALKSKILQFKLSGFMIVFDLVIKARLDEDTLTDILKLLMRKVREEWFEIAMNVVLAICQYQDIKAFPKKVFLKLLCKGESLNLNQYLTDASSNYNLTGFIEPFVNTAFKALAQEEDEKTKTAIISSVESVLNLETLDESQASAVNQAYSEYLLAGENGKVSQELRSLLKQIATRFPSQTIDISTHLEP